MINVELEILNDNIITNSCYYVKKVNFVYFFDKDSNIIYKEYLNDQNINKKFKDMLDPIYKNYRKPYKIVLEYDIYMDKCIKFYDKFDNNFGKEFFLYDDKDFNINFILNLIKKKKYKFDYNWINNNIDKIMLLNNYDPPQILCSII